MIKKLTVDNFETNYSITDDGSILKKNNLIVNMCERCEGYPVFKLYIDVNTTKRLRLDRLMYENFLGGKYSDGIPIFHIDGNQFNCNLENLHVGFMEDERYPNEIWKRYSFVHDDINKEITKYFISTYGRCYNIQNYNYMKLHSLGYPIRIKSEPDEIYWTTPIYMIAESFIPNKDKKPYAVSINKNGLIHVSNIGWSYSEKEFISEIDDLTEDLKEIYRDNFKNLYHLSDTWRPLYLQNMKTDYIISKNGNIFNIPRLHLMRPHISNSGYKVVKISISEFNIFKNCFLHRLIAQTFIPNPDNLPFINHIDGNKQNNDIQNLEWCTPEHNVHEAIRLNLIKPKYDDQHHASKLSSIEVENIIIEYLNGKDPKEIYRERGLDRNLVNRILRGVSYKKIAEKYNLHGKNRRSRFIDEYKPKIFNLLDKGVLSEKEICRILKIDYPFNRGFVRSSKKKWKEINGII